MTTNTTAPAWARGYPLEHLRQLAQLFAHHDRHHTLGAFSRINERDIADHLDAGTLVLERDTTGTPVAAAVRRKLRTRRALNDFTGEARATAQRGDVHVLRWGWHPDHDDAMLDVLRACRLEAGAHRLWVQVWQESDAQRHLLDQLWHGRHTCVAVKIPASAELIGTYTDGAQLEGLRRLEPRERWGLRRLDLTVPPDQLTAATHALERLPEWADHYSSYNKRHSWAALALRGYADDPAVIEKPAEMSKAWKAEHPHMLREQVRDTPLRAALPELEPLIALVPGAHQRIRLMRLQPGGGELTRHADITDPEAGTAPGKVLRIHLPLVTNEHVRFTSWQLGGLQHTAHMRAGTAWYLDTRKPHTARNGGDTARIHLVIDTYSNPALLALLERGTVLQ